LRHKKSPPKIKRATATIGTTTATAINPPPFSPPPPLPEPGRAVLLPVLVEEVDDRVNEVVEGYSVDVTTTVEVPSPGAVGGIVTMEVMTVGPRVVVVETELDEGLLEVVVDDEDGVGVGVGVGVGLDDVVTAVVEEGGTKLVVVVVGVGSALGVVVGLGLGVVTSGVVVELEADMMLGFCASLSFRECLKMIMLASMPCDEQDRASNKEHASSPYLGHTHRENHERRDNTSQPRLDFTLQ
jgi:hypothetical protein